MSSMLMGATACHEEAIGMVNGKAKLLREDYCDGLGDCLPACPVGAISFEEREAPAYNEKAVSAAKHKADTGNGETLPCGCPGTHAKSIHREESCCSHSSPTPSQLKQWPVQIKLLPPNAPYFDGADILVAADCTAYAYGNFHNDFIKGRITLVGCPKLDSVDYSEKLTQIFADNDINSVTVARMQVPCCGGLEYAVKEAIEASGKNIPCRVCVISPDGKIIK